MNLKPAIESKRNTTVFNRFDADLGNQAGQQKKAVYPQMRGCRSSERQMHPFIVGKRIGGDAIDGGIRGLQNPDTALRGIKAVGKQYNVLYDKGKKICQWWKISSTARKRNGPYYSRKYFRILSIPRKTAAIF